MKKTGRIVILLMILFPLTFSQAVTELNFSSEVIMNDLRFIQETLEQVHPLLIDEERVSAFRNYADEIISKANDETSNWQANILAQQLLRFPEDAHTSSDITSGNRHFLPLSLYWATDGLVVFPFDAGDIPPGSEILRIGELTVKDIEQKLSELISGNMYWVRAKSTNLLATETILRYLDVLENDTVSLTYRTPAGETAAKKLKLQTMTEEMYYRRIEQDLSLWEPDETWTKGSVFAWKVDTRKNFALFSLQSCDYNDEFIESVKAFFAASVKGDVKNVVVDLRNNGGGDSRVVMPFLEHLPTNQIQTGGEQWRLSTTTLERYNTLAKTFENYTKMLPLIEEAQKKGEKQGDMYISVPKVVPNTRDEDTPIFEGNFYVITNNHTFSAAIDFAVLLSDNKLATLVGEPVGDAPSSDGELLKFETPNLNLPFQISTKIFVRPDPSLDPADTLEPDIYLPLTVKDIQQKHDPIKTWLDGLE